MFGVGVVMTSVFTLLTPLAATFSVGFLIAVRVLEGFFEVIYAGLSLSLSLSLSVLKIFFGFGKLFIAKEQ